MNMSNGSPKYVENCPVLLPDETHRFFSKMKASYDGAWAGPKFEAGSTTHPGFKTGYSDPRFNGHNQSATISTSKRKK